MIRRATAVDHDLRNHLAVILGLSEILLAGTTAGDPRRDDLEEIRDAATAALDLVAQLASELPAVRSLPEERRNPRAGGS